MDILEYYESRKKLVDEAVLKTLKEEELEDFETPKSGKRLRGVLAILVCEALGGKIEDALVGAVAIELAHSASLDVDDVVDLDLIRRGRLAEWVRKGIAKTVLGSHTLVSTAMDLIRKHYGVEALETVIDVYKKMVKGEIKDAIHGSLYESVIMSKTAILYGASAVLGALASKKRELKDTAYYYGLYTGMAFQIADDIVDTIKIIDELDLKKLLEPSVSAFIAFLGLETILRNPLNILLHGVKGIEEHAKEVAMKKLDEYINKAQSYANQLPAVNEEYTKLLNNYPTLVVSLMLKEGGLK
jgi:geranylgeranyl pyrophosphate synthase